MKILVLGGDGMLGHRLFRHLRTRYDCRVTLRQDTAAYTHYQLFTPDNSYYGIDVRSSERITEAMADFAPDAVVNAVGIVKQRPLAIDAIPSLEINALLPHRLAVLCRLAGARLLHVSTDCVFSGARGNYSEDDVADAHDLYGRSKLLGEVAAEPHCLTIRTSIIGFELARRTSLLEWFLSQRGSTVKGFRNAIFSGFTTAVLSRIIEMQLTQRTYMGGVLHVASRPINKFELLTRIRDELGLDIDVVPDDTFRCDRSLDAARFRSSYDYEPPDWDSMIQELGTEMKENAA
jgi:dTDP-4-dehydrorhamnose reductase